MEHKYKVGDVVKVKSVLHNADYQYKKIGIITDVVSAGATAVYDIIIAGIEGKTFHIYELHIEGKLL